MVNVQTIKTALSGLKNLSTACKVGLSVGGVGVLGLSILIPSIINKNKELATLKKDDTAFEKDIATLQAEKNALQAQCDSLQNELNKLNEKAVKHSFEYTPEREYAVSDTTFNGAGNPERIKYFANADNRSSDDAEVVFFNEDGSIKQTRHLKRHGIWTINGIGYDDKTVETKDGNGKKIQVDYYSKKGDYLICSYDEAGQYAEEKGNNNNSIVISEYYPPKYGLSGRVLYNKDDAEITHYDKKNDRIIKIKQMKDGVLDYTVVPKYDKDGIVVQRDTIWNNQKKP